MDGRDNSKHLHKIIEEANMDWNSFEIDLNSLDTSRMGNFPDLHLAAELGKTLLDRNRELELLLKEKQTTIEDQKLEIEYLTKQTVALKEVNDSRLRIYEQLEVSIQDLERTNHRLQFENSTEKKHIKSLNATIEQLETKCEELQSTIDDLRLQIDVLKKKSVRNSDVELNVCANQKELLALRHVHEKREKDEPSSPDSSTDAQTSKNRCTAFLSKPDSLSSHSSIQTQPECDQNPTDETDNGMEEMAQLLTQLRETRAQCSRHERIIAELEEQLATMVQQNQALENQVIQLSHRGDDLNMKSMHEELTTLDEVRQGQMCSKCLRSLDQTGSEIPEDDDQSMLDDLMTTTQHRSSFSMNVQDHVDNQSSPLPAQHAENPYKVLVEKYEALVEVHRKPVRSVKSDQCPSLQEEMQMSGDFTTTSTKDTDEESGHGGSLHVSKRKQTRKTFSTPTDFSEAETSSSGFADETSNKGTQTEGRVGSFLCTIADGEDCKFSIYDDASPFDSRFRDRPEYRDLFKEIFRVLKKAAENKAEGEDLPLLDDNTKTLPKVPPVTPMTEQLPEFPDDDTQSILSSTMSELSIQNESTTIVENIIQSQNQPIPEGAELVENQPAKDECVLRPLVRQPLEYISVEVRKRSSSRRKNKFVDRSDSPVTHIIGSPKITYSSRPNSGRKRREVRQNNTSEENVWNGNTLQFWATNRNVASPTPSQGSGKAIFEFKPSSASQDLHKLKKLDMSYAEVLRNADNRKRELYRQRRK